MSNITRIETNNRMSRVVMAAGMVYLAGVTASDATQDIKGQTQQVLDKIDNHLASAGVDKTRIVSTQIWLADIGRDFAGMNEVWEGWMPQGHAPARATCEARLATNELLVEIIVVACAHEDE